MKVITPRQQDRRNRILECTRQQVAYLGYDGVNMRDLAVEADVSTATLYNLFKSKDDLILAASQDLLADIAGQVGKKERGLNLFLARYMATADTIIANPKYAEAMGRMLFAAEPSAPIVNLMIGQSRDQIVSELKEMQSQGELIEGIDLEKLARNIAGVSWSAILLLMKGFIALHDFREEYMGNIINMLLPWLTDETAKRCREMTSIPR